MFSIQVCPALLIVIREIWIDSIKEFGQLSSLSEKTIILLPVHDDVLIQNTHTHPHPHPQRHRDTETQRHRDRRKETVREREWVLCAALQLNINKYKDSTKFT